MSKKLKVAKEDKKIFVLDTSVLVYAPNAYESFKGHSVIIPITVLDELDKLKRYGDGAGRNARVAIRNLDAISDVGEIHLGITIKNNISIKIDTSPYGSLGPDPTYGDAKILACAAKIKENNPKAFVVLISKDINLRTRAKAFGILAQDYEKDKLSYSDLYDGFRTLENEDIGEVLNSGGVVSISDYKLPSLFPNECVLFTNKNGKGIGSGRVIGKQIKPIKEQLAWNLEPKNKEQLYAIDLLLDANIPLVSIIGAAGSGKSLMSVACGLELVLNRKIYNNFILYRPIQPMGNDVGYLPGSLSEKLDPWFAPIDDSFAYLFSDKSNRKDGWKTQLHQYITNGTIQKEALTYIRGRSIPKSLILIDEAQNISKEEIKTILTRVGMNSKIIINGDISQIDNNYLDATNNGLTYTIEKFKTSELAGHISFKKGERSALATLASEIL